MKLRSVETLVLLSGLCQSDPRRKSSCLGTNESSYSGHGRSDPRWPAHRGPGAGAAGGGLCPAEAQQLHGDRREPEGCTGSCGAGTKLRRTWVGAAETPFSSLRGSWFPGGSCRKCRSLSTNPLTEGSSGQDDTVNSSEPDKLREEAGEKYVKATEE